MDSFDLKPERKIKINAKSLIWNFLTILVLLGIACQGWYFLTIFSDPTSRLNFFPPQPLPTLFKTVTPTFTKIQQAPTWTGTPTLEPPATRTRAPTWTLLPALITPTITETPTITDTPTITSTPTIARAEITYKASTDYHPDSGCNWLGVAGQVFDKDNKPLINQQVQVGGTLEDKTLQLLTLSGTTPKSEYGIAGFELVLSDHTIDSTQSLWIQLFDQSSQPLTNKIYFDTYSDCSQNLVFVVFTRTR